MAETADRLPPWAHAFGRPCATADIRIHPEDFRVWEIPLITPSGEGNHLWLEVEKNGANTTWVAGQLARAAGASARDVGYAGMKDRHGITTQWFSVGLQEAENDDWRNWSIADVSILRGMRHARKLQRGALRGNRFRLVLRRLRGSMEQLEHRLEAVRDSGVPNYFGPQRFGRAGANIPRARDWLARGGRIPRNKRSLYLSSLRSYLFNEVLSERVSQGNWNRILAGDIALLDGSRSMFDCEAGDPELEGRCAAFDIHPTGPLPGGGGRQASLEAAATEQRVLARHASLVEGLVKRGVVADRRSLRLRVSGLAWRQDDEALQLEFELPPGSYATSVLRELVQAADAAAASVKMNGPQ